MHALAGYRMFFAAWMLAVAVHLCAAGETALAVINAGVSTGEDSPYVTTSTTFLPGDYVYFTFEAAGFEIRAARGSESRRIALKYQVTPQDAQGRALTEAASGEIEEELAPEDKNWVPKRRASFVIPSFVAAGAFRVHVTLRDVFAGTQAEADIPFAVGGTTVTPSEAVAVEQFAFLRNEAASEPLQIPAYSAGDKVFARFNITGFQTGPDNSYHLAYSVVVLGPDGKPYIRQPDAAQLTASSFYPARFVPANIELKMGAKCAHGAYIVELTVRDLLAKKQTVAKESFSIE